MIWWTNVKLRLVWANWLVRYWLYDKYREAFREGLRIVVLGLIVGLSASLYLTYEQTVHAPEPIVVKAYAQWVVQLILLIVSMIIQYALAPKPEQPKPQENKAPEVEDGKSIRKVYGEVWIDDPMVLGWKDMGIQKIKAKGGKK